jgi:4-hydroxy-tetrahydrodipicolinate reductase
MNKNYSMTIALLGYGRMGKEIETIALNRDHTIGLKTSSSSLKHNLEGIDVAIDFSIPEAAIDNITQCLEQGIPVISGTTGWLQDYNKMVDLCKKTQGAFMYASNFSLGVNLFFELNKQLAKLVQPFSDYQVSIEETHHTKKLDAPSGTAITLAETIIDNSNYNDWTLDKKEEQSIPITALRQEHVPGTHLIQYDSSIDSIEIKHTAHNRKGFALGAVVAAEWLVGKTGIFTMKDVLNIR